MDLSQIETNLSSEDFQDRLKAVSALKEYDADVAIPLLLKLKKDPQFLVRSFVAMGLGKKKTAESFATLLEMVRFDRDTNVRAEAANSLSLFGEVSIPHLQQAFHQDDNWLVRLSILGALMELNCPNEIFDVCLSGIAGDDEGVSQNCINCFGQLVGTSKEEDALQQLLTMINDPSWRIRMQVAKALINFTQPEAQQALNQLRQDCDHRVVGAVLENNINS